MPAQAMDASTLLRLIRADPELRQAIGVAYGSSEASVRSETRWAIGFSAAVLVVLMASQAVISFVTPLPANNLQGLIPDWQLRLASFGPLSMQFLVGVFVWSLTKSLAARRERRIARKLLDALAPGFDRRGLA
jgi:hypothetical protein